MELVSYKHYSRVLNEKLEAQAVTVSSGMPKWISTR
jgi:hypothetical protein